MRRDCEKEYRVNIAELVFAQKHGMFFVWRMDNGRILITFLRNRKNISPEIQTENAIHDGRERQWALIGVGQWHLNPIKLENTAGGAHDLDGIALNLYNVSATLLRLKKLPDRELRSTEVGVREMRETWIPHICERLRKILWEDGE